MLSLVLCLFQEMSKINFSFQIIETMSFSTDVASFMEALGPFYEYVSEEQSRENDENEDSGVEVNKIVASESNDDVISASLGKFVLNDGSIN